jgi:predicted GNAT family N-acyltransferase
MSTALAVAAESTSVTDSESRATQPRAVSHWPGDHLELVHGDVVPADVRAGDPVTALLGVARGGGRPVACQVWRLSPLGAELVRPAALRDLAAGSAVDLTLRVGRSLARFSSLPVLTTALDRGRELLAFAWPRAAARRRPAEEERGATRWTCEGEYRPTGVAPCAARFGDFVYFRVVDVSWSGMQLETSLRNKYLVPGLRFAATCTFPTQGLVQLDLQVIHARVVERGGKPVLAVGVRHARPLPTPTREAIGQYLLQFGGGATVADLCAEGFAVPATSRALDFGAVRTADEYADVLRLRRLAYVHARKLSEATKDVDMADDFDARSRILAARHRGRVVGTVRLMFPTTVRDALKHEDFLALPACLPPRDQLVEVSKACTHPGYRGGDLFYALLKHTALTIVQSGRRWALMSATDALVPVYRRCGFQHTGASYVHPSMQVRHHLMVADMQHVVAGRGLSPIVWNLLELAELWSYARECGAVRADPWTAARLRAYRLLRPAAAVTRALLRRRARAPRPRGH